MDRRLYEHNLGHSKFTSTGVPWVWFTRKNGKSWL
ncbi:GIY-YIG nuclease family protein [Algoriphagus boritolerans]